jgi:hypothetical protein
MFSAFPEPLIASFQKQAAIFLRQAKAKNKRNRKENESSAG